MSEFNIISVYALCHALPPSTFDYAFKIKLKEIKRNICTLPVGNL